MQAKENNLETGKIGRLLLSFSMPSIIAMMASSLYNIVDRIFIGQGVGPMAISGLALTLPVINMGVALGALVGAGSGAILSIRLGEKRIDEAEKILGNLVTLNIIISNAYAVIMLVFLDPVLVFFGASEETLPYARDFMQIILAGNFFQHSYLGLNCLVRAAGAPMKAMVVTLITVAINAALAPVFIFLMDWGIRGAAFATVISQIVGSLVIFMHFMNKSNLIRFKKGIYRLRMNIVKDIFSIGMSPFVINLCVCLITIVINLRVVEYGGDYAVGAFGIINVIIMCMVLMTIGLAQGMQPIVGYNYGARQYDRVRSTFKLTVITATIVTTLGFLCAEIFPRQICLAFTNSEEIIGPAITGMRICIMFFPIIGFFMITSNFFQSIGKASLSIILALSRQTLFLLPGLVFMPMFLGLEGVWTAMATADVLSAVTAFVIYKIYINRLLPE